jgi:tetratricopeptide (TPR) repeat protein
MDDRLRELLNRGREHYLAREYDRAERYLAELAREQIAYADVYDMLGVIYHQQGRLIDAETVFKEALRINPAYTEAALNLAVTLNDLGKYREAKEIYERAMAASKNSPRHLDPFAKGKIANMHADVGAAYHAVGLFEDAVREYERALALCPKFVDIRTKLGATFREMGNIVAAVREFERVKTENPKFAGGRLHLGLSYYAQGRREEAAHEWQQVLAMAPDNKSAQMYLAMVRQSPQSSGALPTRAQDPQRERDIAEGQVTTVDLEPRGIADELAAAEMGPPPGTPVAIPTDTQITRTYVSLDAAENMAANLAEDPDQDPGDARQATDSTPDGSKSG